MSNAKRSQKFGPKSVQLRPSTDEIEMEIDDDADEIEIADLQETNTTGSI